MMATKTETNESRVGPFTIQKDDDGFWVVLEGRYFDDGPYDTRDEATAAACSSYATRLREKLEAILLVLEDASPVTVARLEQALNALNALNGL